MKRTAPEASATIVAEVLAGEPVASVARRHGVHPQTVYTHLLAAGHPADSWRRSVGQAKAATPELKAECVAAYDAGAPLTAVAAQHGVSVASVSRWVRAARGAPASPSLGAPKRPPRAPASREDLLADYAAGLSIDAVAAKHSLHPNTVRRWLGHTVAADRRLVREEVIAAIRTGSTVADVAKKYGVSRSTVRNWLKAAAATLP